MHLQVITYPSTTKGLTTAFRFVFSPAWASSLRLGDDEHDDVHRVTMDLTEIRRACSDMSTPEAEPVSDLDKIAFAHSALAHK
jgi:hypothetical protein